MSTLIPKLPVSAVQSLSPRVPAGSSAAQPVSPRRAQTPRTPRALSRRTSIDGARSETSRVKTPRGIKTPRQGAGAANQRGLKTPKASNLQSQAKESGDIKAKEGARLPSGLCAESLRDFTYHFWFKFVIVLLIILYIGILAWTGPQPDQESGQAVVLRAITVLAMLVTTLELCAKVVGLGFAVYVYDAWNVLEIFCWLSVVLEVSLGFGWSILYMRILQIAQLLKRTRYLHETHLMVEAIGDTFRNLPAVCCLIFIFVILMALLGQNVFGHAGAFRNRCLINAQIVQPVARCANATWSSAYLCERVDGQVCVRVDSEEPLDGIVSFDHAPGSVLAVLIVMLQQDFTEILYAAVDTSGEAATLWFPLITVFGTFFLLNYTTSIVAFSYATAKHRGEAIGDQQLSAQAMIDHNGHHGASSHQDALHEDDRTSNGQIVTEVQGLQTHASMHNSRKGSKRTKRAEDDQGWRHRTVMMLKRRILSESEGSNGSIALANRLHAAFDTMIEYEKAVFGPFVHLVRQLMLFPYRLQPDADTSDKGVDMSFEEQASRRLTAVDIFVSALSLVDLIVLSIAKEGMNRVLEDVMYSVNYVLVFVFFLIEILRLVAYTGPIRCWRGNTCNQFDFGISSLTLAIALAGLSHQVQLSQFRFLRVVKIFGHIPAFDTTYRVFVVAMGKVTDLSAALVIVLLTFGIFALILRQTFIDTEFTNERKYVGSFMASFITVFELVSGESMRQIMTDGHKEVGGIAIVLLLLTCFILNHVVVKIFTAVLLSNFVYSDADRIKFQLQFERLSVLWGWDEEKRKEQWMTRATPHIELLHYDDHEYVLFPDAAGVFYRIKDKSKFLVKSWLPEDMLGCFPKLASYFAWCRAMLGHNAILLRVTVLTADHEMIHKCKIDAFVTVRLYSKSQQYQAEKETRTLKDTQLLQWNQNLDFPLNMNEDMVFQAVFCSVDGDGHKQEIGTGEGLLAELAKDELNIQNLMLVTDDGSTVGKVKVRIVVDEQEPTYTRSQLRQMLEHGAFEAFMLIVIIVCVSISLVQEFQTISSISESQEAIDWTFLIIFATEAGLKLYAFGAFRSRQAYFRSSWNRLDFGILILMLFSTLIPSVHSGLSKAFAIRIIRIFRPIMTISRASGLQHAVSTLVRSAWELASLLVIVLVGLYCWAICGLHAYRGRLSFCSDPSQLSSYNCLGNVIQSDSGYLVPRIWDHPHNHFDNLGESMMSMYHILNRHGWVQLVDSVIFPADDNGVRAEEPAPENGLIFVSFAIFANLFMMQFFTVILINGIDVTRRRSFLTHQQKVLQATERLIRQVKSQFVKEPQETGIRSLQKVVHSPMFETVVTGVILLNTAVMLSSTYNSPEAQQSAVYILNQMFIVFYCLEQAIKILAFGINYFMPVYHGQRSIAWLNIFDFMVTAVALFEAALFAEESMGINIFRSFRILRLLNALPSLAGLLAAAQNSLPVIAGCFGVLLIFVFSFAVIGTHLLGGTKRGLDINRNSNFDNPLNGFMSLCRVVGGEDWPALMQELRIQPPYCTPSHDSPTGQGDCGQIVAVPYFVIFSILSNYGFLPLFIASLISAFFETVGQPTAITHDDITVFKSAWIRLDPDRTGFIAIWKTRTLMELLGDTRSILYIDVEQSKHLYESFLDLSSDYRKSAIKGRQQSSADGLGFVDTVLSLVLVHKFHSAIPKKEQLQAELAFRDWSRGKNTVSISDWLAKQIEDFRGGHMPLGRLHIWIEEVEGLVKLSNYVCELQIEEPELQRQFEVDLQSEEGESTPKIDTSFTENLKAAGYRQLKWRGNTIVPVTERDSVLKCRIRSLVDDQIIAEFQEFVSSLMVEPMSSRSYQLTLLEAIPTSPVSRSARYGSKGHIVVRYQYLDTQDSLRQVAIAAKQFSKVVDEDTASTPATLVNASWGRTPREMQEFDQFMRGREAMKQRQQNQDSDQTNKDPKDVSNLRLMLKKALPRQISVGRPTVPRMDQLSESSRGNEESPAGEEISISEEGSLQSSRSGNQRFRTPERKVSRTPATSMSQRMGQPASVKTWLAMPTPSDSLSQRSSELNSIAPSNGIGDLTARLRQYWSSTSTAAPAPELQEFKPHEASARALDKIRVGDGVVQSNEDQAPDGTAEGSVASMSSNTENLTTISETVNMLTSRLRGVATMLTPRALNLQPDVTRETGAASSLETTMEEDVANPDSTRERRTTGGGIEIGALPGSQRFGAMPTFSGLSVFSQGNKQAIQVRGSQKGAHLDSAGTGSDDQREVSESQTGLSPRVLKYV